MELLRPFTVAFAILVSGAQWSAAQPDNDRFENRFPLAGTSVVFDAYLLDATMEPGEPDHGLPSGSAEGSAWWTWTAPAHGVLELVPTNTSSLGMAMALYRGSELTSLTRVANWRVEQGETYQIAAFHPYLWSYGRLTTYQLTFYPPPPNDLFANSILLEGVNAHFEGWTHGATREPGEAARGAGTVWWHWRAPAAGVAQLVTDRDYYFRAVIGVFQGTSVNALTPVPYVYSLQTFDVRSGEVYHFAIAGNAEQDYFRFSGQVMLSPLRIEEPLSGTVYPSPTDVVVRLSSAIPETSYSSVAVYGSNGYPQVQSPNFASHLVFSNLPAGQYNVRAVAWNTNHMMNYVSPEVAFRILLPNDHFTNSTRLEGTNITVSGDTRRATAEPGEIDTQGSIWWRWTAPESGWGIIKCSQGNYPPIQVFRGEQLTALTLVPRRPERADFGTSAFPAEHGATYHIRATGDALPSFPAELFRLTLAQAQLNDDFANRTPLGSDRNHLESVILLATPEPGEPAPLNNASLASVWYTWTAPAAGTLCAQMVKDNQWGDGVALFSGDALPTLRLLASPLEVQPGETVQIALYGDRYSTDPVSAEVRFFPTPANDMFENAELLTGSEGEIHGQTVGATGESAVWNGEYKTIWYQWTAPSNGMLGIATPEPGSCCYANVALYTGSDLSSLARMEYRADLYVPGTNGEPGWRLRQFDVQAATTYHILVFSEPGVSNPFQMTYQFDPAPPNDVFVNRASLQGNRCLWSGSSRLASREPGEPVPGQAETGRSLWWQWTAPASGWGLFRVESTNSAPMARVYEGSALTNLSLLQTTYSESVTGLWFQVEAGRDYVLLVDDGWNGGGGGEFSAELDLTTAQVVLSDQDPDFTAPRHVWLELSEVSPELDGELIGVQFYNRYFSNMLGVATTAPFRIQTPLLQPGWYQVFAMATNRAGEVRHCAPCEFTLSPGNDLFSRRRLLRGRSIEVEGTLGGASREPGEPLHTPSTETVSVWYTWQAEADGEVRISAIATIWPEWITFGLGVYTGENLAELQPVASAGGGGAVNFSALRGETFQLAVEGYGVPFILRLQQASIAFISPVDYDVFLEGLPITFLVASTERPEDIEAIELFAGQQLLATLTTPPYEFIWTNAPPGGTQVTARGRLAGGETNPPLDQVYIGVAPKNDSFAGRQPVSGTNVQLRSNTTYARWHQGQPAGGSVWVTWTPPWSGLLRLGPPAGEPCPYITVFTGSTTEDLVEIVENVGSGYIPLPLALLVRPGTNYHIAVRANSGDGNFALQLEFEPAPVNDDFGHQTLLTGNEALLEGALAIATAEPGEPPYFYHYGDQPRHSLWWTWVAPERGAIGLTNLTVESANAWFKLDYGFYAGSTLAELVLLTNIHSSLPTPMFQVEAGQSYHLAINTPLDTVDLFTARFLFVPGPANDPFENRQVITGRQLTVPGSTLGASAEWGEPIHWFGSARHSVWYSWTAPFSGIAHYRYPSQPWYRYAAYVGDRLTNLTPVPRPPDISGFTASQGTVYAIAVDSAGMAPGMFEFSLLLRRDTPPPNDLFADRILLEEGAAPIQGWNHYASREWQEPRHADRWGGRSVWYAWTPAVGGPAALRVRADEGPLLIGVYEGTEMANLIPVAQTAPSSKVGELQFAAQQGHEYAIALDGEEGATSEFEVQIIQPASELRPSLELTWHEQGHWMIVVRNLAGRKIRLESSSDLRQWESEGSHAGGTDEWYWSLPAPPQPDPGARFFRAVTLEFPWY